MKKYNRSHEDLLRSLLDHIREETERVRGEELTEDELPTSAGMARKLEERQENVKKKLKLLKDEDLVHSLGVTPKHYRFNPWGLKALERDEDNPLHFLVESVEEKSAKWDDWD